MASLWYKFSEQTFFSFKFSLTENKMSELSLRQTLFIWKEPRSGKNIKELVQILFDPGLDFKKCSIALFLPP